MAANVETKKEHCEFNDCLFKNIPHFHCNRCGDSISETYRKLCDKCRDTNFGIREYSSDGNSDGFM